MRVIAFMLAISAAGFALAAPRLPHAGAKSDHGPSVKFDEGRVVASGVARNATVAFASLSLSSRNYELSLAKAGAEIEADSGGVAAHVVDRVERRSLWLIVDTTTGGFTIASPPGMLLREMDFPGRGLSEEAGSLNRITVNRPNIDVFVVRKGGVWTGYLHDGLATDEDRTSNGGASVRVSSFTPLVGTMQLDRIMPGDVVFVVDRNSLEFTVLKQGGR